MSIDGGWGGAGDFRRAMIRGALASLAAIALAGCGGGDPEAAGNGEVAAPVTAAGTQSAAPEAPATVADLFPAAPERELVLNNCANCHAVACAAMGQRSATRWNELEASHREHVGNLPDEDRQRIFAYLRANFNETRPEPVIPPAFLDRGCTPF